MAEKEPENNLWPQYLRKNEIVGQTVEEILAEYRMYVHDPEAELPEALVEELKLQGKIIEDESR